MDFVLTPSELVRIEEQLHRTIKARGLKHALYSATVTYETAGAKMQNTVLPKDKEDARVIRDKASFRIHLIKEHRREEYMRRHHHDVDPMEMEPQPWVEWMLNKGESFDYIIGEADWWSEICDIRGTDQEEADEWKKRAKVARALRVVRG